jgi:hypothetical protein
MLFLSYTTHLFFIVLRSVDLENLRQADFRLGQPLRLCSLRSVDLENLRQAEGSR